MSDLETTAKMLMNKSQVEYDEQCKSGIHLVDKPLDYFQAMNLAKEIKREKMSKLNISHSEFESNYHDSRKCGGNTHSEYLYHNVDVFTTLKINDEEYQVIYQEGQGFYNNDYSMPYEDICLSEEGGTDRIIILIDRIGCELEELEDKEAKELLSDNNIDFSVEDARKIYEYICEILNPDADLEYIYLIESSEDKIKASLQEKEREDYF